MKADTDIPPRSRTAKIVRPCSRFARCRRTLLVLLLALPLAANAFGQSRDKARLRMVREQIESRGIDDVAVLRAMRIVPRHRFVPEAHTDLAYRDHPLPIGHGQTISQPYIVALMTEVAHARAGTRFLEIGTGSGYQAAVLGEIVDEVVSIEIIPELASSARERLQSLGYENILVHHGDGYHGFEEKAPFDGIIVTAAAEHIPPPLVRQLKDGGRMVIPVGTPFLTQSLMLVEKKNGKITTTSLLPVRFVPFTRSK